MSAEQLSGQLEQALLERLSVRHNPAGPDARASFVSRGEGVRVEMVDGRVLMDSSCGGILPFGYGLSESGGGTDITLEADERSSVPVWAGVENVRQAVRVVAEFVAEVNS